MPRLWCGSGVCGFFDCQGLDSLSCMTSEKKQGKYFEYLSVTTIAGTIFSDFGSFL